jgi:hypothetical protein
MTQHWVDAATGRFIATLAAGQEPSHPTQVAVVPSPPSTYGLVWDGAAWVPGPVPASVPSAAWRRALFRAGLLDAAEAAAVAVGGEQLIAWRNAARFYRADLVPQLGAVGVTEAQLDGLLVLAEAIDQGVA